MLIKTNKDTAPTNIIWLERKRVGIMSAGGAFVYGYEDIAHKTYPGFNETD